MGDRASQQSPLLGKSDVPRYHSEDDIKPVPAPRVESAGLANAGSSSAAAVPDSKTTQKTPRPSPPIPRAGLGAFPGGDAGDEPRPSPVVEDRTLYLERRPLAAHHQLVADDGESGETNRPILFDALSLCSGGSLLISTIYGRLELVGFKITDVEFFSTPCLAILALHLLSGIHTSVMDRARKNHKKLCRSCREKGISDEYESQMLSENESNEIWKVLTQPASSEPEPNAPRHPPTKKQLSAEANCEDMAKQMVADEPRRSRSKPKVAVKHLSRSQSGSSERTPLLDRSSTRVQIPSIQAAQPGAPAGSTQSTPATPMSEAPSVCYRPLSTILWCWLCTVLAYLFAFLFQTFSFLEYVHIALIGSAMAVASANSNGILEISSADISQPVLLQSILLCAFLVGIFLLYFIRASISEKFRSVTNAISQAMQDHIASLISRWITLFVILVSLSGLVLFMSYMYARDGLSGDLAFETLQNITLELEVLLLFLLGTYEYLQASTSINIENNDLIFMRLPTRYILGYAGIVCGPLRHLVAIWWCYMADTAVPSVMDGKWRWLWTSAAWLVVAVCFSWDWIRRKVLTKEEVKQCFMLFISYCWKKDSRLRINHDRVSKIYAFLKEKGILPFQDKECFVDGDIWGQIVNGINNSRFFAVFLTPQYVEKVGDGTNTEEACCNELNYALNTGKIIIFVILDKGDEEIRTIDVEEPLTGQQDPLSPRRKEQILVCNSTKLNEILHLIPSSRHFDLSDWSEGGAGGAFAEQELERLCRNIQLAFPLACSPSPAQRYQVKCAPGAERKESAGDRLHKSAKDSSGGNNEQRDKAPSKKKKSLPAGEKHEKTPAADEKTPAASTKQKKTPTAGEKQKKKRKFEANEPGEKPLNIGRPRLLEFVLMLPTMAFYTQFLLRNRGGYTLLEDLAQRIIGFVVFCCCLHLLTTDVDSIDYVNRTHMLPSRLEIIHLFAVMGCVFITAMESHESFNELGAVGIAAGCSALVLSLIYILKSSIHNKCVFKAFSVRRHLAGVLRRGYACIAFLALIVFYSSSFSVRHGISVLHPWQAAVVIPMMSAHIFLLFLYFELLNVSPDINPENGDILVLRLPLLDLCRLFLISFPTLWMLVMLWCWAADSDLPAFLQPVEQYNLAVFAGCWALVAVSIIILQWPQILFWRPSILSSLNNAHDVYFFGTRKQLRWFRKVLKINRMLFRPKGTVLPALPLRIIGSNQFKRSRNRFGEQQSHIANSGAAIVCISENMIAALGDGEVTTDLQLEFQSVIRAKPRSTLPLCHDSAFLDGKLRKGIVAQAFSGVLYAKMDDASSSNAEQFGRFKRCLEQTLLSHCGLETYIEKPTPTSKFVGPEDESASDSTKVIQELFVLSFPFELVCVIPSFVVLIFLLNEDQNVMWFTFDKGFLNVIRFTPIAFSFFSMLWLTGCLLAAAVRLKLSPDSSSLRLVTLARWLNLKSLERFLVSMYRFVSPIELIHLGLIGCCCYFMFESFKQNAIGGREVYIQEVEKYARAVGAIAIAALNLIVIFLTRRKIARRLAEDPLELHKHVAGLIRRILFVVFLQLFVVGGSLAISWRFGDDSDFAIRIADASIILNINLICTAIAYEVLLASADVDLTNRDIAFARIPIRYTLGFVAILAAYLFFAVYLFANALYHAGYDGFVANLNRYYFECLSVIWFIVSILFAWEWISLIASKCVGKVQQCWHKIRGTAVMASVYEHAPKVMIVFDSQSKKDVRKARLLRDRLIAKDCDVWPKFPYFNRPFKPSWKNFKDAFTPTVIVCASESFAERMNVSPHLSMDARACANQFNYTVNNAKNTIFVLLDKSLAIGSRGHYTAVGLISMRLDAKTTIHLTMEPGVKEDPKSRTTFDIALDPLVQRVKEIFLGSAPAPPAPPGTTPSSADPTNAATVLDSIAAPLDGEC